MLENQHFLPSICIAAFFYINFSACLSITCVNVDTSLTLNIIAFVRLQGSKLLIIAEQWRILFAMEH